MDRLYIPVIILHLSIVAKKHSTVTITQLQSLELLTAKYPLLHMLYCMNWLTHDFGLEQEGASFIAPMALAHPLHPIDNRSSDRRRNLWVGWCVSSWWPLFPPGSFVLYIYIYIYIHTYIYIKWTVFVNVTTESAQHAHARMIAIIVVKSPNSSHMYDHGFMDNTMT